MSLVSRASSSDDTAEGTERVSSLLKQRTELQDVRRRLHRGDISGRGIRAHLRDPAVPLAPPRETGWILAIWATVSVPLLLLALAAPLLLSEVRVLGPLLGLVGAFSVAEQLVRRRFNAALRLSLLYVAIALFVGFVGVIAVSLFALGAALAVAAVLLFIGNLGELSAVRRRADPMPDGPVADDEDRPLGAR